MRPTVAVTDSLADARKLAPRWRRLAVGGASAIYTSPEWCLAAWNAFPDLGPPHLATVMDGGTLLGLLPLTSESNGNRLTWAGSPLGDEHDARIDARCHPEEITAALLRGAAEAAGADTTPGLTDVRSATALTRVVGSRPGCPAPVLRLDEPDADFGPLACIPDWSRDRRRGLRAARRHLDEAGSVTFERITGPARLCTSLPRFVASRLAAWSHRGRLDELPGMDRHVRFPDFITEAATGLSSRGLCYLAVLSLDGDAVAQSLLFRSPGADLLYMSTYRPDMARYAPSHLLLAEIAAAAFAEGVRVIELGRGDEPYRRSADIAARCPRLTQPRPLAASRLVSRIRRRGRR
jgi:CelD/BcsL family acetyltransferase involved in cellulose biosynthesis